MDQLQKQYRQSQLDLACAITQKHLENWKCTIDANILETVCLLQAYGFTTTLSCEGHPPGYKKVDTFRQFYPYININLIHQQSFDYEKKIVMTASADHIKMYRRLENIVILFNSMIHPFFEKHLEMAVLQTKDPIELLWSIEHHASILVMLCDKGVASIKHTPQELLNDSFRKKFLKRTQHQMKLFTKFLRWYAIEDEDRELFHTDH